MSKRLLIAGMIVASGWLGGCASPSGPISLSISELGSEVQEDAGSLFAGIRHRRSYNITGLGSSETVGMLSADPDPPLLFRWPSLFARKTLPDQLAPRITSQCSRVAVHDLPMAAGQGMREVIELRDSLDALHAAEVELQRSRALALLLGEIVATYEVAATAAGAASPPSGAPPERRAAHRSLLVDAWRGMAAAGDAPGDVEGWQELLRTHVQGQGALVQVHKEALNRFREARKQQGLIVARWEYEASQQGGLAAIGINVEGRQARTRSGFVVMGHPRTLTLISGNDLMARTCAAGDANCVGGIAENGRADGIKAGTRIDGIKAGSRTGIDTMIPARRLYTTTFQLLAQHVAWAESGSVERQFALKAKLSEIVKALNMPGLESFKAKLEALDADVGFASRSATSGENLGAISGAVHWEVPFTFWRQEGYVRSVAYLRALNGNFVRISSMRTTLDAYASRYGGALAVEEADACVNNAPTPTDVRRATHAQLACGRLEEAEFVRTLDPGDLAQRRERCIDLDRTPAPGTQTAAAGAQ
ncbi:MAG: hypothetical protein HZC37_22180 [Burkholderiales bacterium]|nr:hypothetical protein [Burkholderiales bacterium]